jgi:hypothetical protein
VQVTDPRGGVRQYGCVWEPGANGHLEGYHFANFTDGVTSRNFGQFFRDILAAV